jgi:hypothetical protein
LLICKINDFRSGLFLYSTSQLWVTTLWINNQIRKFVIFKHLKQSAKSRENVLTNQEGPSVPHRHTILLPQNQNRRNSSVYFAIFRALVVLNRYCRFSNSCGSVSSGDDPIRRTLYPKLDGCWRVTSVVIYDPTLSFVLPFPFTVFQLSWVSTC